MSVVFPSFGFHPFGCIFFEFDLEGTAGTGMWVSGFVMVTPDAFEQVLEPFSFAAAGGARRVDAAIVIFDDECAWQIVRFHEHGRLVKVALFFPAVADETPDMRVLIIETRSVRKFILYGPCNPGRDPAGPGQDCATEEVVFLRVNEHRTAIHDLELKFISGDPSQERVVMVAMRGENPVTSLNVLEDVNELAFVPAGQMQ